MNHSRRILNFIVVGCSMAAVLPKLARAQSTLKPTPQDALGPYYPSSWAGEIDADLLSYQGKTYKDGTPLLISGRVLGTDENPISGATVEIWQADLTGKYRHKDDDGEGPAQRGFQGFGRILSDKLGRYAFRTVKPAVYGGRPAHVHFRVTALGFKPLVTQMYFEGENKERSFFGGFSKERDRLTVKPVPREEDGIGALGVRFDLVLANG